MNKIKISDIVDPNIQQGFTGYSVDFLQKASAEQIKNIILALIGSTYDATKVYILWGCVRTGAADGAGSGSAAVSAGAVFFNGEAYTVDAFATANIAGNNLYSAEATTDDATADPCPFSDGISRSVHNVRKWLVAQAGSGSNLVNGWINIYDQWQLVTGGIGFQNSWSDVGGGEPQLRFKRDGQFVILSGTCGNGSSNTVAITLPSGYRPTRLCYYTVPFPGDLTHFVVVSVNSSGQVNIKYTSGTTLVSLENIRIPLD